MNLSNFFRRICWISIYLLGFSVGMANAQDKSTSTGESSSVTVPAAESPSREAIDLDFTERLREIAAWCQDQQLETEKSETMRVFLVRDPQRQYIFLPDRAQANSTKTASNLNI